MFNKKKGIVIILVCAMLLSCGCEKKNYYDPQNNGDEEYVDSTELKKVEFKNKEVSVCMGSEKELEYIVAPSSAEVSTVFFESSDGSVVAVDENGKIKGLKIGTATVTGRFNGTLTCECNVTVTPIPSIDVESDATAKAYKNDAFEMSVALKDFGSGMIKIVTDGVSGAVTCGRKTMNFSNQTDTIYFAGDSFTVSYTVTVDDGNASVAIYAYDNGVLVDLYGEKIEILTDKLDVFPTELTLYVGDTVSLGSSETDGITWSSTDTGVASVSGGVVTAKKAGTAKIKATNGKATGSVTVNVLEHEAQNNTEMQ